jgi:putative nucleotidyltransferase with HDIG domain
VISLRRVWVYAVGLTIVAALTYRHVAIGFTLSDFALGLLVAIGVLWLDLNPLKINDEGDMNLAELVHIASLLCLGLPATAFGIILGEISYGLVRRQPVNKVMFNAAQILLSVAAASYIFRAIGGSDRHLTVHALVLPLVYVIVNIFFVSSIVSLSQQRPFAQTWTQLNRDFMPYSPILAVGGLVFGGMILSYGWFGLLLSILQVIVLRSLLSQLSLSIRTLKTRYIETVRALMTALEYRDPFTYGHSSRVANWCGELAAELGLATEEIAQIKLGGLVHDVGKVGVPDHVLNKPGKLSPAESDQMKEHTVIGERILLNMEGMQTVANMARQHHLYYNGDARSYPDHIPGRETSIGSRILAVADAWDAMVSDRPYRKALSIDKAVVELLNNRSIQFDPDVVDTFIKILKRKAVLPPTWSPEHLGRAVAEHGGL